MIIEEVKAYRCCNDLEDFDFTVVIENNTNLDMLHLLDDLISSWYQYPTEFGDMPLGDFLQHELERKKIHASIYFDDMEDEF